MSALNFFLTNSNISVMLVLELFLLVGDGWIPVLHWVSISTSLAGCGGGTKSNSLLLHKWLHAPPRAVRWPRYPLG